MLAYPPHFVSPREVTDGLGRNFPNLITSRDLVESRSLVGAFKAEEMVELAEKIAQPNWKSDIVFLILSGPILAYGDMLLENCGATFQHFPVGGERCLPQVPKLGGYLNLSCIRKLNLAEDVSFLSKVAAEEILHIFAVPKSHDPLCFFHPQDRLSNASHRYDYCQKCLDFMATLAEPLNYEQIYKFLDRLYGFPVKPPVGG